MKKVVILQSALRLTDFVWIFYGCSSEYAQTHCIKELAQAVQLSSQFNAKAENAGLQFYQAEWVKIQTMQKIHILYEPQPMQFACVNVIKPCSGKRL